MVNRCDRVGTIVQLIAVGGFKQVLFFAEDRAAQLPVAVDQR